MIKNLRFIIILFSTFFANASENLPSNYVKMTVSQQIQIQKQAYDKLYNILKNQENSEDLSTFHLNDLFPVLENAISLVHTHINTMRMKPASKNRILQTLKAFYDEVVNAYKNHLITYRFFLRSAETLAQIEDLSKLARRFELKNRISDRYIPGLNSLQPFFIRIPILDKIRISVSDACEYIESEYIAKLIEQDFSESSSAKREPTLKILKSKKQSKRSLKELFSPTIVIYGDYQSPTKIPIRQFVDQAFAKPYSANLALFDPLSETYKGEGKKRKKSGTKKDAHYSMFNGTFPMFTHDITHIIEKKEAFEKIHWMGVQFWKEALQEIYNLYVSLRNNEATKNDSIILENGLFILTHEIYNILSEEFIYYNAKTYPFPIYFIKFISLNMQKIAEITQKKDPEGYKKNGRDYEFILSRQGVHDEEGPFVNFEKIKSSQVLPEQKAALRVEEVINGYKRFWKKFEEIIDKNIKNPDAHRLIFSDTPSQDTNIFSEIINVNDQEIDDDFKFDDDFTFDDFIEY